MGSPCPNRQLGGCIFCRPAGFTPAYLRGTDNLNQQIARGKAHLLKGRFTHYFAYFQQETCTAVPLEQLMAACTLAIADADCHGLIISTRPDYVPDDLLHAMAGITRKVGKECLFELGLQSVHDRSLRLLNRNHNFRDFQLAAKRIRQFDCFALGAHLLFGIPEESDEDMLLSLTTICALGVTHLKLHHLQVLRDTPLATLWEAGKVSLFTKEAYIRLLLRAVQLIPAGVIIHRLFATSHPHLLLAPHWDCLASTLSGELQAGMAALDLWQGQGAS